MRSITLQLSITLLILSPYAFADKKFPGIESLMTNQEFSSTGLEKLSHEEMQHLNQWLIGYTANEATLIKENVAEVKKVEQKDIESSMSGQFKGWSGKTVFKLNNGQVWQQRQSGSWRTNKTDPTVTISKNLLGYYQLRVEGSNRTVGVKRIK